MEHGVKDIHDFAIHHGVHQGCKSDGEDIIQIIRHIPPWMHV
jgi:hypothetical protein